MFGQARAGYWSHQSQQSSLFRVTRCFNTSAVLSHPLPVFLRRLLPGSLMSTDSEAAQEVLETGCLSDRHGDRDWESTRASPFPLRPAPDSSSNRSRGCRQTKKRRKWECDSTGCRYASARAIQMRETTLPPCDSIRFSVDETLILVNNVLHNTRFILTCLLQTLNLERSRGEELQSQVINYGTIGQVFELCTTVGVVQTKRCFDLQGSAFLFCCDAKETAYLKKKKRQKKNTTACYTDQR